MSESTRMVIWEKKQEVMSLIVRIPSNRDLLPEEVDLKKHVTAFAVYVFESKDEIVVCKFLDFLKAIEPTWEEKK